MYNNFQYRDYYISNLKKALKPIDEEIKEEESKINPDNQKINKLKESQILAGLFSDAFGYNERFRNPW